MTEYNNYSNHPPPPPASWSDGNQQGDWRAPYHGPPRLQPVDPNPNLYIHNVPKDATEEELKDLFSAFGTVERIRLKVNQKIGPQALYAFVTFNTTAEAHVALQRLNGYDMRSRRLRIEFQRSREEEPRTFDGGNRGGRDFSRMNQERRKRPGFEQYSEDKIQSRQWIQGDSEGPAFKKVRQQVYDDRRRRDDSWVPPSAPAQEPIKVFLFDLLKSIKPELFTAIKRPEPMYYQGESGGGQFHQQTVAPPLIQHHKSVHQMPIQQAQQHQAFSQPTQYNQPAAAQPLAGPSQSSLGQPGALLSVQQQPTQQQPPQPSQQQPVPPVNQLSQQIGSQPGEPSPGTIVWTGSLLRNSRKKVPVDVCAVKGNISQFLGPETFGLNISHRSSWDEVMKKPLAAVCYINLSDNELTENGSIAPLTQQKKEVYKKSLSEHVEYLSAKQRAGVVSISNGSHLYLVPPSTPLFEKFMKKEIPQSPLVLLGLFAVASAPGATTMTTEGHTSQETYCMPQDSQHLYSQDSYGSQQPPSFVSQGMQNLQRQQQPPPQQQQAANNINDMYANYMPRA